MNEDAMLTHNDELFSINAMVDSINQRIWVANYSFNDALAFSDFIKSKAQQTLAQKVIIPARQEDVDELKTQGFILEGVIEGYLNGAPVNFMVTYPKAMRAISKNKIEKMRNLDKILSLPLKESGKLPAGYVIRKALPSDAPALAELFGNVFTTYPTPLDQTEYVLESMNNNVLFYIILYDGKIVSTAAAEMDLTNSNAEMTNCATHPAHQGLGLMSIIIKELEKEVLQNSIRCLYSLSRASEFGINLILHRLGYNYRGTLINNCHICGDWEDMHLWAKNQ